MAALRGAISEYRAMSDRAKNWLSCNVLFVSWHKHWKGVYLHFFPVYCVRVYLWGIDWHRKRIAR